GLFWDSFCQWIQNYIGNLNSIKYKHFIRQKVLSSLRTIYVYTNVSKSKEPWKCDPCNTGVNAKKSTKEYTKNDVMEKLIEMDQNHNRLFTKYKEQLQINERIQNDLSVIKKELNNREQMELNNNIIVNGIPYLQGENTEQIIQRVANKLGVSISNKTVSIDRLWKVVNENCHIKIAFENLEAKKNS
ncbi:hypothetical protein HHI36_013307, partial [Cryptolaemus montrouzieri]